MARGARWGNEWPRGTVDYGLRGGTGEVGGHRRNPTIAALRSMVAVEHNFCGTVVESLLENGVAG